MLSILTNTRKFTILNDVYAFIRNKKRLNISLSKAFLSVSKKIIYCDHQVIKQHNGPLSRKHFLHHSKFNECQDIIDNVDMICCPYDNFIFV